MKDLILGDLHVGIKNSNNAFRDFIFAYITYIVEYCVKNEIDRIIQVGDLCHSRYSLTHKDHDMIRAIFQLCKDNGIEWMQLVGNHDATYKHTLISNTPDKIAGEYDNVTVINHAMRDNDYSYIPWICDDNRDECMTMINSPDTNIAFGHFELDGWEQTKGHVMKSNMKDDMLNMFDHVYTGHYHVRCKRGNITYVGTPYPLTKNDIDHPHGFDVIDRETKKAEFIENDEKWSLFQEFNYNGESPDKLDVGHLKERIVFFNLNQRVTPAKLKKIKIIVDEMNPIDVKYIVNYEEDIIETSLDESILKTDSKGAISDYINEQDDIDPEVKPEVIDFLHGLISEIEEGVE